MKKMVIIMLVLLSIISGRHLSHAKTHSECNAECGENYDKCVAPVVTLPEPRTPQEQAALDQCSQDRDACRSDCDVNSPQEEHN